MPSSQFRDLEGKMEVVNNQARIVLSGPEKALGFEGLTGDICIEDPVLGIKTKARISLVKQPKVRVIPKVVKLEKVEGRENYYQANFFVKASADSEKTDEAIATLPSNTIQEIECDCNAGKTTLTKTKISDSLYRVKVQVATKKDVPAECVVKWKVRTAEGLFSYETLARFQRQ